MAGWSLAPVNNHQRSIRIGLREALHKQFRGNECCPYGIFPLDFAWHWSVAVWARIEWRACPTDLPVWGLRWCGTVAASPGNSMPKSNARKPKRIASRDFCRSATKKKAIHPSEKGEPTPNIPTNKLVTVITLLRRPEGANIDDLMKATGWQAPSVRAFVSRAVKKKQILTIGSEKCDGNRIYRVAG